MQDYSKYPYGGLLIYIETMCKQRGEERDYITYLFSMERAESIEKLIKIYDNLYKLLAVLFYGTNKFPKNWYMPETWGHDNTYLIEELNWCLNENILKWYKRQNNPSEEICLKCLANLRESENLDAIKGEIMECFPDKKWQQTTKLLSSRNFHYAYREQIRKSISDREAIIGKYMECCKILAGNGRIFDVAEIAFAKQYGISYDGLIEEYQKYVELERLKKLEEEENKKREKRREIINMIRGLIGLFAIIGLILFFFAKIGGIIGLIIIIGIIGLIPKLLLTGKI